MSIKPSRQDVIRRELAWHEQQAEERRSLNDLLYAPPVFDKLVGTAFDFLGIKAGERVLEIGGGEGKEAVTLAQRGGTVVVIDLSAKQLKNAQARMEKYVPDAIVYYVQGNAEALPFAGNSFRIAHAKAIIHHLDLELSAKEIKRVLQPHGRVAISEPMAHHPLFWLARRFTPNLRTADEHPLQFAELTGFGNHFAEAKLMMFFFLAPLAYFVRLLPFGESLFRQLHSGLQRVDSGLFRLFPAFKRLAWYGVILLKMPAK